MTRSKSKYKSSGFGYSTAHSAPSTKDYFCISKREEDFIVRLPAIEVSLRTGSSPCSGYLHPLALSVGNEPLLSVHAGPDLVNLPVQVRSVPLQGSAAGTPSVATWFDLQLDGARGKLGGASASAERPRTRPRLIFPRYKTSAP